MVNLVTSFFIAVMKAGVKFILYFHSDVFPLKRSKQGKQP